MEVALRNFLALPTYPRRAVRQPRRARGLIRKGIRDHDRLHRKFDFRIRGPLARARRGGRRARVYRIGLRLDYLQSPDPGALSRTAVVVQPALYDVHDRPRAAWPERRIRGAVGGA